MQKDSGKGWGQGMGVGCWLRRVVVGQGAGSHPDGRGQGRRQGRHSRFPGHLPQPSRQLGCGGPAGGPCGPPSTCGPAPSPGPDIHNWVLFLLWLHPFILSGVISPLISSSILGTYQPGEFIFQCHIFLPFHTTHESFKKTSTSALLTMPKSLTVWITTNCGKF